MPVFSSFDNSKLRAVRKQAGLTREQLAVLAGCSVSAIALWETGGRSPAGDYLLSVSAILGCNPHDFYSASPNLPAEATE